MNNSTGEAIAAANRRFEDCVRRRDYAAIGDLYTEDAKVLPPDAPIVSGRAAIKAFWPEAAEMLGLETLELRTLELSVSGDIACEIGEAHLGLASGPARVKYVVVWRREADGQWRLAVDIWNALPNDR